MRKIYHIMLILFVSLKINSCAEIDKSSEFANPSLTEQLLFSEKNILAGNVLKSSENLFTLEQTSTQQDGNSNPKYEKNIPCEEKFIW